MVREAIVSNQQNEADSNVKVKRIKVISPNGSDCVSQAGLVELSFLFQVLIFSFFFIKKKVQSINPSDTSPFDESYFQISVIQIKYFSLTFPVNEK